MMPIFQECLTIISATTLTTIQDTFGMLHIYGHMLNTNWHLIIKG